MVLPCGLTDGSAGPEGDVGELACAVEAGYGDLPRPNVAAQRASSGYLHLGWNLRTPVHRGAASRPRPLAALGRIAESYAVTLRSDRGYVGVLAYNPVHGDYNTVYPRTDPYDLAELARALPGHWRRPSKPADLATAPGRNCGLFAALCKLALGGSDEGLLTLARTLNSEFAVSLPESEVRVGVKAGLYCGPVASGQKPRKTSLFGRESVPIWTASLGIPQSDTFRPF